MNIADVAQIAAAIKADVIEQYPVLIAIDGFGGSGKSTIAASLKDAQKADFLIGND